MLAALGHFFVNVFSIGASVTGSLINLLANSFAFTGPALWHIGVNVLLIGKSGLTSTLGLTLTLIKALLRI